MKSPLKVVIGICIMLVSATMALASLDGMAIAVQTTTQWYPGNLTLVSLPGTQKTVLHEGSCWGPCFSSDGRQVAFIKTNGTSVQDGKIHTININGTDMVNTNIPVKVGDDDGHKSGGTALYWLSLNGQEYFYWSSKYNGGGWFRCKRGTTTVEHVLSNDGAGFWGGVDRSGVYASGTGWDWAPRKYNLSNGQWSSMTGGLGGCNTSVSPNGEFVLHNLNTGYWSGSRHTHAMIRRRSDNSEVKLITLGGGNFDNHRWSHHSMDVIMWRHYTAGNGVVVNHVTNERINIGGFVPYDFFPGTPAPAQSRYREPGFSPAGGVLPTGKADIAVTSASSGVSIRYTLNGSEPTTTQGTMLANGGQIPVSIAAGQSLVVKAIAFKTGSDTLPSIVAATTFSAPEEVSPLALTSPEAGDVYMVGQTLPVRWTARPDANISRIDATISFDGENYIASMSTEVIDASAGQLDWTIPREVLGVATHSREVTVRIEVYGAPEIYSETGLFSIRDLEKVPLKSIGTPIVSVTQPGGTGSKDIDIIGDDVYPPAGSGFDAAYDTYNGQNQTEAWFGYEFSQPILFGSLQYKFGRVGDFGGHFSQMKVQVRDANGSWADVAGLSTEPAYNAASVLDFGTYALHFTPKTGTAIRVIGAPSNNEWVGCAELDVDGQVTASTGRSLNPALANAVSGILTAALGRVNGSSMLILSHGDANARLQVTLIDVLGKTVQQTVVDHNGRVSMVAFDRGLSPGLYTVVVSAKGILARQSVILAR